MEDLKRWQIPAFGQWDHYYDDLPVTQYFESAWHAGLIHDHSFRQEDQDQDLYKTNSGGFGDEKKRDLQPRKQCRVYDVVTQQQQQREKSTRPTRAPKAVDEDLYKIPPELLHQKTKRKKGTLSRMLSGCLCLGCVS